MNKTLFNFTLLLIALFLGAIYYESPIKSPLLHTLHNVKKNYLNSISYIDAKINQHLFQQITIQKLQENLATYENNHLVMQQLAVEINELYEENKSPLKMNAKVDLVRTLSYETFGNFNRVWIDMKDYNPTKIYGLTYKELVAGIIINKNDRPLALLNRDIKSSYAVFVGSKNAPGIAHGNNDANILINFIPIEYNIQKGDEVISSGLDNLFFKGLKVGKVLSISKSQGYNVAVVKPYYNSHNPNYFHIIRSTK